MFLKKKHFISVSPTQSLCSGCQWQTESGHLVNCRERVFPGQPLQAAFWVSVVQTSRWLHSFPVRGTGRLIRMIVSNHHLLCDLLKNCIWNDYDFLIAFQRIPQGSLWFNRVMHTKQWTNKTFPETKLWNEASGCTHLPTHRPQIKMNNFEKLISIGFKISRNSERNSIRVSCLGTTYKSYCVSSLDFDYKFGETLLINISRNKQVNTVVQKGSQHAGHVSAGSPHFYSRYSVIASFLWDSFISYTIAFYR